MSDRVRPRNVTWRIAYTITTPQMVRPTTAAKTSLCPQIPNRSSRHNALCVPGGRFCHPPHRTYRGISAIGGAQNSALGEGRASRYIRKDIGILLIRRYPTAGKSGCASPLVRCALARWVDSDRFKASLRKAWRRCSSLSIAKMSRFYWLVGSLMAGVNSGRARARGKKIEFEISQMEDSYLELVSVWVR
jgi:hypothetical protein